MTDHRARLEQLIADSSMFRAGQVEERLRICTLIDIRLDELAKLPSASAGRRELLKLRALLSSDASASQSAAPGRSRSSAAAPATS